MVKRSVHLVAAVAMWLLVIPARAAEPVHTGWFGNVAVGGYDVVAYFTRGEPVEGLAEHSMQWRGVVWRFASEEHLRRFRQDPRRYAPAYGGHCAYAVAQGMTAAGDPEHWTIHRGQLYLNYDAATQEKWDADRDAHIAAADENWPGVAD